MTETTKITTHLQAIIFKQYRSIVHMPMKTIAKQDLIISYQATDYSAQKEAYYWKPAKSLH